MHVYEFDDYREFLSHYISENKRPRLMTELAEFAGCDRTYLSQVMTGKAQLTTDHAINLAEAINLNRNEVDYFLLLVMKARASNSKARGKFQLRAEQLRAKQLKITNKVEENDFPAQLSEDNMTYYSRWQSSAIHIGTSVNGGQTIEGLSERFSIPRKQVQMILEDLVRMQLVKKVGAVYQHSGTNLHLPADSPHIKLNHVNWRLRAIENFHKEDDFHYSTIFAIAAKDIPRLKNQLLDFVSEQRNVIHSSGSEEVYVFCCDLFMP